MTNQYKLSDAILKQTKYLNTFWLGFIIYIVNYVFSATGKLNYIVCQAFQSLGIILIVFASIYLIKFRFINKYLQTVFIIYCAWLILIILRGFSFDYVFIKQMLFDAQYGMLPYFAPLILVFPKNLASYKKLFDVIILLCVFYIIYDLAFIKDLLNSDRESLISQGSVEHVVLLSIPASFLLLTFNYHSKKRKIFSIIIITTTLFFAIYRARRGLIVISSSQLVFAYFLYLFNSRNKFMLIFSSILILFIGAYSIKDIFQSKNSIFSFVIDRGTEDTRTGVELYFYADLKTTDWIIGRGIAGKYFCPGIEENQKTNYRDVIETGYLQIILRGGLVNLILTLLIVIPAIFLGLFYSRNMLSKAAGLWILASLIYSYPATIEAFSLYYLIYWMSIGICYSKVIRNIPEKTLIRIFSN